MKYWYEIYETSPQTRGGGFALAKTEGLKTQALGETINVIQKR